MKKPPTYNDPAATWLLGCSKAALVDYIIERLRLDSGRCDDPVGEREAQKALSPVLRARGDSVAVAYSCERPS